MKRVLAVWLSRWADQCRTLSRPETDARAALIALAKWCYRYAPSVGVEEGETPETLLLDATNLAPLYSGEERLIIEVARGLKRRRLEARLAIADTIGAAWGLSHYETSTRGDHVAALPVAALRLDEQLVDALAALGIDCVDQVLALPREQLRSRFGPQLLLRVDQLTGATPEAMLAVPPMKELVVERKLDFPLTDRAAINHALAELMTRLARLLSARAAGALTVACRIVCEKHRVVEFEIGLFHPSASSHHLLNLLELELERVRLPAPAIGVELRVVRQALTTQRQQALFDDDRRLDESLELAALVDRLAGRLGSQATLRCRLANDAQPELAFRTEPLVGATPHPFHHHGAAAMLRTGGAARKRRKKRSQQPPAEPSNPRLSPLHRPTRLFARPLSIEALAVAPDGPPMRFLHAGRQLDVVSYWGPERIETGWWRRRTAARDYWRVETADGARWWLFRELRTLAWFLHGAFE